MLTATSAVVLHLACCPVARVVGARDHRRLMASLPFCASSDPPTWPATDHARYHGPFNARPTAPVLLVGTRFDPAAYSNAIRLDREAAQQPAADPERLGHVALGRSACVQQHVADYLITVQPPRAGTTCQPDRRPFQPLDPSERR